MMQWSSYGAWGADRWLMVGFMALIFLVATIALLRMLWTNRGDRDFRSTSGPAPRVDNTLSERSTDGASAGSDATPRRESTQTNHL